MEKSKNGSSKQKGGKSINKTKGMTPKERREKENFIENEFIKSFKEKYFTKLEEGHYVFIYSNITYSRIMDYSSYEEKLIELDFSNYLSKDEKCFFSYIEFDIEGCIEDYIEDYKEYLCFIDKTQEMTTPTERRDKEIFVENEFIKLFKERYFTELEEGHYVFISSFIMYDSIEEHSSYGEKLIELDFSDYLTKKDMCFFSYIDLDIEDFIKDFSDYYEDILNS